MNRPTKALRNLVQLVTDAAHSQNITRVLWIGLKLLSQAIDMWIDVALVAFVIGTPNAIEQSISRPRAARLRSEQLENLKLERRQIDTVAVANHFVTALVDHEIAHLD